MNFFKNLFDRRPQTTGVADRPTEPRPDAQPAAPARADAARQYYETISAMKKALSKQDFDAAAECVRESLKFIAGWVVATGKDYGSFVISSIPTIEQGGRALALAGDDKSLSRMREIIAQNPELQPWAERAAQHTRDRVLFDRILEAVIASPGCLQSDVKAEIGEPDADGVAVLVSYLERAGKLARIKVGKDYKLVPPGDAEFPVPAPKREVGSHRSDRQPPRLYEVDISKLEYVPLPRSPLKWEETQAGRERALFPDATEPFEVRDATWLIKAVEKIPPAERPDTAFRVTQPCATGLLVIDDLGNSEGIKAAPAAALHFNRAGEVTDKAALLHDIYRYGVHTNGRGLIAMSRGSVLHAYDYHLKPIIETALASAPEIAAIRKRFDIPDDELKNHIRCVALSRDEGRYLFTVVDEAWCISANGVGIWGAKLPAKEGWTRVATPSSGFGTSGEVADALRLMGLMLPITPEELKSRYRSLAKQWHPDLNRSDPKAGEKMVALSAAAEILTGIDPGSMAGYAGVKFSQEIHRSTIEAGGHSFTLTMGIQVSEKYASDWIYAAGFAGASDAVYLAGYSGRVVQVDENGKGVRIYDIGSVPRQIIDTGKFLYFLTYTRLYVIRDNALHALIDTFDGGDLVMAQNGFGFLEKKRLRWYNADGSYVGSVVTKAPIRRVYFAEGHMVVETRTHRAMIEGVADWWA
jgi:hypothetical protein